MSPNASSMTFSWLKDKPIVAIFAHQNLYATNFVLKKIKIRRGLREVWIKNQVSISCPPQSLHTQNQQPHYVKIHFAFGLNTSLEDIMLIHIQIVKLFIKYQWNKNKFSGIISPPSPNQSDPNVKNEVQVWTVNAKRSSSEQRKEWWTVLCQGLGVFFLDSLGHRGISSTLNWSLFLFDFDLDTRSFFLQVINNSLYLRGFTTTWSRWGNTTGEDIGHSGLDKDVHISVSSIVALHELRTEVKQSCPLNLCRLSDFMLQLSTSAWNIFMTW